MWEEGAHIYGISGVHNNFPLKRWIFETWQIKSWVFEIGQTDWDRKNINPNNVYKHQLNNTLDWY